MDLGLKQEKDLRELFEVESGAFASGLFASVKRARSRRTGQLFAAKHSPKRKENYNEVRLLSKLISPYIITFKDAFETSSHVVVIMEFAPGGDMQSLIDADVVLNESHASRYIHQLLQGLAYLHSKSIAHLDIKPQNLLLMGDFPHRDSIIKICDFELSRVIDPHREEREIVGTPDYVAPEVLQYDPLSLKADIWSTGIVVYVLLTGFSPFGGETDTETFNNIIHNEIDFPPEIFEDVVSHAGIEFISWLCQKNLTSRPTAAAALQHVWLKSSRLSSRKKGMSKSTYDLTKTQKRDKVPTEKVRLRKSKSREQLWRSKIHLSLSSEKIERWASVASFTQAPNVHLNAGGRGRDSIDATNIRVHSEESLLSRILPTNANSKDEMDVRPELTNKSSSPFGNGVGQNHRNGALNSNGRSDPYVQVHEENGLKLLPRARLDELTPGDKIKETVGEDEVQKSVAELISKFGGTHLTKKQGKGGGSSTATNSSVNLDPIEEMDDQENNDNSLTIVDQPQNQQGRLHAFRKSIASNSSASSSGGSRSSSTTTIDDIKATLAQLLPLNLPASNLAPIAPVPPKNSRDNNGPEALNGSEKVPPPPPPARTARPNAIEVRQPAQEESNPTLSIDAPSSMQSPRKISTSFYVPLKSSSSNLNSQAPQNFVPFPPTGQNQRPRTRHAAMTARAAISTSASAPVEVETAPTATVVTSTSTATISTSGADDQQKTTTVTKRPTNRFISRCEMRIRERANQNQNSTNANANASTGNANARPTGRGGPGRGAPSGSTTRPRGRLSR